MSWAELKTRYQGYYTAIKTAIRNKGVTVADADGFGDFSAKIGAIPTGTDVSDTTATAADVRSGKYFYTAAGVRTDGTIYDRNLYTNSSAAGTNKGTVTPAESAQYILIAKGYVPEAQYMTVGAIQSDYKKQKVYTAQTGSGSRSYPAAIGETRTLPYKTYTETEIGFTPRGVMIISQDSSASQCSGYWSADITTVYGGSYWQSVIQTQYFKSGTTYYIPLYVSSTVIFYA